MGRESRRKQEQRDQRMLGVTPVSEKANPGSSQLIKKEGVGKPWVKDVLGIARRTIGKAGKATLGALDQVEAGIDRGTKYVGEKIVQKKDEVLANREKRLQTEQFQLEMQREMMEFRDTLSDLGHNTYETLATLFLKIPVSVFQNGVRAYYKETYTQVDYGKDTLRNLFGRESLGHNTLRVVGNALSLCTKGVKIGLKQLLAYREENVTTDVLKQTLQKPKPERPKPPTKTTSFWKEFKAMRKDKKEKTLKTEKETPDKFDQHTTDSRKPKQDKREREGFPKVEMVNLRDPKDRRRFDEEPRGIKQHDFELNEPIEFTSSQFPRGVAGEVFGFSKNGRTLCVAVELPRRPGATKVAKLYYEIPIGIATKTTIEDADEEVDGEEEYGT